MRKLLAALVALGFLATSGVFVAEAAEPTPKCRDDKKCKKEFFNCVLKKSGAKDFEAFKAIPNEKKKEARKACRAAWRSCCGFPAKSVEIEPDLP